MLFKSCRKQIFLLFTNSFSKPLVTNTSSPDLTQSLIVISQPPASTELLTQNTTTAPREPGSIAPRSRTHTGSRRWVPGLLQLWIRTSLYGYLRDYIAPFNHSVCDTIFMKGNIYYDNKNWIRLPLC